MPVSKICFHACEQKVGRVCLNSQNLNILLREMTRNELPVQHVSVMSATCALAYRI